MDAYPQRNSLGGCSLWQKENLMPRSTRQTDKVPAQARTQLQCVLTVFTGEGTVNFICLCPMCFINGQNPIIVDFASLLHQNACEWP